MAEQLFARRMDDIQEIKSLGPDPQEGTVPLAPHRKKRLTGPKGLLGRLALAGTLMIGGNEAIKAVHHHFQNPEKPLTEQTVHASEPKEPAAAPQAVKKNTLVLPMLFHAVGSAAIKHPIPVEPRTPTSEPITPTITPTPPVTPTQVPPPTPTLEIGGPKKEILIPSEAILLTTLADQAPVWDRAGELIPEETLSPVAGTVTGSDGSQAHIVKLPDGSSRYCRDGGRDGDCKIQQDQQLPVPLSEYGEGVSLLPKKGFTAHATGSIPVEIVVPHGSFGGSNKQNFLVEMNVTPGGSAEQGIKIYGNKYNVIKVVYANGKTSLQLEDLQRNLVLREATSNGIIAENLQLSIERTANQDTFILTQLDENGVNKPVLTAQGTPMEIRVSSLDDRWFYPALYANPGGNLHVDSMTRFGQNLTPMQVKVLPQRKHGAGLSTRNRMRILVDAGSDPWEFVSPQGHGASNLERVILGTSELSPFTNDSGVPSHVGNLVGTATLLESRGIVAPIEVPINKVAWEVPLSKGAGRIVPRLFSELKTQGRGNLFLIAPFMGNQIIVPAGLYPELLNADGSLPTNSLEATANGLKIFTAETGRRAGISIFGNRPGEIGSVVEQLKVLQNDYNAPIGMVWFHVGNMDTEREVENSTAQLKKLGVFVVTAYNNMPPKLTIPDGASGAQDGGADAFVVPSLQDISRGPQYPFGLVNGQFGYNRIDEAQLDRLVGEPGSPFDQMMQAISD